MTTTIFLRTPVQYLRTRPGKMDLMLLSSTIVLLSTLCVTCSGIKVLFTMQENNQPGSVVGNIIEAAGIQRQDLQYSLLDQGSDYESCFSVDEVTGNITTVGTIDRESLCEFTVDCELVLEVGGYSNVDDGYFTVIRVVVIVEDENDNAPLFPDSVNDNAPPFPDSANDIATLFPDPVTGSGHSGARVVNLPITENVPTGTTFTLDGARDRDTSAQFSLHTYEPIPKHVNEDLPFDLSFSQNLDGSSKVKLKVTRQLDREVKAGYELYIVAKDGGSPPLSGSLYVNITIEDVNDNYPQFDRPSYNVTVNEDLSIDTVIVNVTAFDLDDGANADVTYRISPHQPSVNLDTFALDSVTGEFRVKKSLDYNIHRSYIVIVEATDDGESPLSTQAIVQVNIVSTGNRPPDIHVNTLPYAGLAEVSEYANVGTVVAHVAILDNDAGQNGGVDCVISHDKFGLEKYDTNEYKVTLRDTLDRERDPFYTVTITCSDQGAPLLNTTETFQVSVQDENDNAPMFKQQRYFTVIDENNGIGEALATVSAFDIDTGNNGNIIYSVAPLSAKYVYVNPNTGLVLANKRFDKEGEEGAGLSLIIYAIDNGSPKLTGTTTLHVSIKDVNDQRPVFVQSHFRYWIDENKPSGTFVGRLRANDDDSRTNAKTTYSVKNVDDTFPFNVHLDGTIQTKGELDREVKSEYTFKVKAFDAGDKSLSSEATVTIIIEDMNDNAPVIHFPSPENDTVYMPFMTSTNTLIYSVIASDGDEPSSLNSKLTYSISTENNTDYFTINPTSGEIFLSAPLSDSVFIGQQFLVPITVRDHGHVSHSSTAMLHVIVTAGNSIDIALSNAESEKNVLIFIIIASVTFAILAVIIVTIFIFVLRRLDAHRRQANARIKVLSGDIYYKSTDKVDNLSDLPFENYYMEKTKGPEIEDNFYSESMKRTASLGNNHKKTANELLFPENHYMGDMKHKCLNNNHTKRTKKSHSSDSYYTKRPMSSFSTNEEDRVLVDRAFRRQNSFEHILLDVSDDDVMYVLLNKT